MFDYLIFVFMFFCLFSLSFDDIRCTDNARINARPIFFEKMSRNR